MIPHVNTLSPQHLLEQLRWRYATKQFEANKEIPADTWSAIEDSLVLTPSSFGLQPWHFVVITNQETKKALLPHSWNQTQVTDCSHFVVLSAKINPDEADVDEFLNRTIEVRGGDLESLQGYRDMMLGFMNKMSPEERLHWAKNQTYIALGQLMSTAATLGIDACPMEGIVPAEFDRILKLTEKGLTTSVACALGYRSVEDSYAKAPKVRFDKKDLISNL